jgi:hypothetical protein
VLVGGRTSWQCPVCGAANCACGGPTTVLPVDQRVTEAATASGPMVRVDLGRGVSVQLREAEARRLGLLPEQKVQQPPENKLRRPRRNKAREE